MATPDSKAKNLGIEKIPENNSNFLLKIQDLTWKVFSGINQNLLFSNIFENLSFEIFPALDKIIIRRKGKFLLEVKGIFRNSKNSLGKVGEYGIKSNWNIVENENLPLREDIKRIEKNSMIKNMAELYLLYDDNSPLIAMKINFPGKTKALIMKKWKSTDFPNQEFYISYRPDGIPEFLLSADYKIIERLSYS